MSDTNQTVAQEFGNVESLMASLQAEPAKASPATDTTENLAEVRIAEDATTTSLNTPTASAETPALVASLVRDEPLPLVRDEVLETPAVAPRIRPELPSLEATIASDDEEAKKNGDTVELRNVVLDVMRNLFEDVQAARVNTGSDRVKELLSAMSIDPNNLVLDSSSNSNPIIIQQQLSILESVKPTPSFPVIALKSGYKATLSALNNNEKLYVKNINGSLLDQTTKLLQLIYSKVQESSVGKFSFEQFLDITAEEDYDTLLYAIYHATFPSDTEYTITCPHCQTENNIKLCPDHLIEVIDQERAGQYVNEVLNGYGRGKEFLKESLVNKPNRIVVPEAKMVFEIVTPTLRRLLNNIRLGDSLKQFQNEIVSMVKYVSTVFVPNIESAQTGSVSFFPVTAPNEIVSIINSLSSADISALRKAISARYRQYRVEYRIPNFNCAGVTCKKEIQKVSIDIIRLIFFAIAGESNT